MEEKDKDQRLTKETKFGTTIGQLRAYNEDLKPREYDWYPKVIVSAAEDLDKFQYGIIRINIEKKDEDSGFTTTESYLVQVDGLMSIVYSVYAKTLNDFRKEKFRQKTVRMYGLLKKIIWKLKIKFSK